MGAANVEMNRPAVELGLSVLDAGGDFADGVIAYEGGGAPVVTPAQGLTLRQRSQARFSANPGASSCGQLA